MMAPVWAMKASWISWRIARRMRKAAEPVQQAIAGSVIHRCGSRHLLQVAAPGADRAGHSVYGRTPPARDPQR
jgi:hypothetical protein